MSQNTIRNSILSRSSILYVAFTHPGSQCDRRIARARECGTEWKDGYEFPVHLGHKREHDNRQIYLVNQWVEGVRYSRAFCPTFLMWVY